MFIHVDYYYNVIANLLLVAQGRVLIGGGTYLGRGAYFFLNARIYLGDKIPAFLQAFELGISNVGSQLLDKDCSHAWQIMATQP